MTEMNEMSKEIARLRAGAYALQDIYRAANDLICEIGAYGEVDSHNHYVHALLAALKRYDGWLMVGNESELGDGC